MRDTKIVTKKWNPITCDGDKIQFHPERLDEPLRWRKPQRVGVVFGGDWMHPDVVPTDWENNPIDEIHGIMMACAFLDNRKHTFFTLTRCPERLAEYYAHADLTAVWEMYADHNVVLDDPDWLFSEMMSQYSESEKLPLPNVFHGSTVCNQEELDRNAPHLLSVPGRHWLSIEPMLGPVELEPYFPRYDHRPEYEFYQVFQKMCGEKPTGKKELLSPGFDWVVVGCESGRNRRLCKLEWVLDVVRQCKAAGVPCYVKQVPVPKISKAKLVDLIGIASAEPSINMWDLCCAEHSWRVSHDMNEWPEELRVRELP